MARKKYGVDMPGTLERSPDKAQHTYAKTLRSPLAALPLHPPA